MKNRIFSKEHIKNLKSNHADFSGEKNPFYGKKHKRGSLRKMKIAKLGKHSKLKNKTYEEIYGVEKAIRQRKKCSEAHIGKTTSEKTRKKQSKALRGEKSYLWKGGKSFEKYGKEFNNWLKKKIRKRDNYTCQYCGKRNCDLYVHHIDYNKTNNSEENLIALCGSCHTATNHNRRLWKDLIFSFISHKNPKI